MIRFPVVGTRFSVSAGFRHGDIVNIKVTDNLGRGIWRVQSRGSSFTIRATIPLQIGISFRARIDRAGKGVVLKMIQEPAGVDSGKPAEANLQESAFRSVAQAFRHFSPEADGQTVRRAIGELMKMKRRGKTTPSILALMHEKGIEADSAVADRIVSILEGRADGEQERGGGRHSEPEDGRQSEQALEAQLKAQLTGSGDGDVLQLFNHLGSANGSWVILPYRVLQDGQTIEGTVRLRTTAGGNITRTVLTVSCDSGEAEFAMPWPVRKGTGIHVRSTSRRFADALIRNKRQLGEKLRNLNLINDDNKTETSIDEFSLERVEKVRRVDELI